MLEKLSSGHLVTLNMGFPSILQRSPFLKSHFTHKIPKNAALERFGGIPV